MQYLEESCTQLGTLCKLGAIIALMGKLCSSAMNQFRDFCFQEHVDFKTQTYQTLCFLIYNGK